MRGTLTVVRRQLSAGLLLSVAAAAACAPLPVEVEQARQLRPRSEVTMTSTSLSARSAALDQFIPLNGGEIRNKLSGHRLRPDPDLGPRAFIDFTEQFQPDGMWTTHRAERGMVVKRGTWRIADDLICVTISDDSAPRWMIGETCRHVWAHPANGKVAMLDIRDNHGTVLIMITQPRR